MPATPVVESAHIRQACLAFLLQIHQHSPGCPMPMAAPSAVQIGNHQIEFWDCYPKLLERDWVEDASSPPGRVRITEAGRRKAVALQDELANDAHMVKEASISILRFLRTPLPDMVHCHDVMNILATAEGYINGQPVPESILRNSAEQLLDDGLVEVADKRGGITWPRLIRITPDGKRIINASTSLIAKNRAQQPVMAFHLNRVNNGIQSNGDFRNAGTIDLTGPGAITSPKMTTGRAQTGTSNTSRLAAAIGFAAAFVTLVAAIISNWPYG